MRKTFLLGLILSAAALLLLPLAPANTAPLSHSARNVLGSLRPATQDPSPEPWPSVPPAPPSPPIQVQIDPPEIESPEIDPPEIDPPEMDAPEIDPIDVDVHPEEIEQDMDHDDADHDDIDIDHDDIDHDDPALNVRAEEKIEKSFPMPSAHRTLEIDNVWGSIEVVGGSSDQAKLTINKSIRAESKEKLEQARKDVTLDITQQPDALKLYVNGPFRCDCHDCNRSRDGDGYIVKMDFQLQVPRDIDIKIKTVNEGRVSVRDINGTFLVRNVNGDIQIHNIAGSGTARTVNGPVKVSFRQNPREASDFQTVNGNIELQFARDLSADFRFKTFNGGIYSDFPVTATPVAAMQQERRGSKVIFRADRYTGARIASGGPQIKVENLNGDIRILENHE
jgi:putative adhesin